MTAGGILILYALVVGFIGPAGFRRASWPVRAPRLGGTAVLAAAWSVPIALLLAGATIVLPASALTTDLGHLIGACLNRLHAAYGTPKAAGVVILGQLLSLAVAARIAWTATRLSLRRRTDERRQRLLIRMAGHRLPELPAVVLDHPGAAAYSLAGRHPTVVVTSGAVGVLTGPQLGAVLAHENAHLRARHHRRQTAAALAARSLPMLPLLREAPALLGRLLEMDADELAADQHEPRVLASALVAVATAGGPATLAASGATSSAPAAGAADAAARIRRLLQPPDRLPAGRQTLTRVAVTALTMTPLVLAAAPGLLALS